ncbi:UDP-N-acetylmuramoyl-L-alanyl-D-glutamate--2,6-diaminopimelate ligase [Limibaculum sp. M0105]|uniref:UDP-N-acetylmuramoyl-L-alanyl-D-glutamate--2,6-diaminopimelate ligase n=1 Tax=Thermohalobaculum xanthum TaxID=2753746 RepID=A0A8J7SEQ6_9RHOB|nr:UDP-N-acetylmuramoyl-L-alanyl-D-glutamate--2,6-diaminopimelate ligase [Thermohalobaculum xanthum]MBK0399661.1 UDP-N-acetylmuramoyl-L-alanyl-D-glutamate--2,6-diaminopimelate ligase [Thermohalobaculum xanthum]
MAGTNQTAQRTLGGLGLLGLPVAGATPDPAAPVAGIAVDSRAVRDGFVFVAVPGVKLDGASFGQFAVRQGALAVVATPAGAEVIRADLGELSVPVFLTEEPRLWLSRLAAAFYARQPEVIAAVTGTNGKTSTAHFLREIWAAAGCRAAAIGTTGVEGDGFAEPGSHTTPEPVSLHALLARLAEKGCTHAVMEASSHGLAQHRLDGVRLTAAALTHITRDHLDYHASFEDYVAAKLRLFGAVLPVGGTAVLNADDPIFREARTLAQSREQRVISTGRSEAADLRIAEASYHGGGQSVTFVFQGTRYPVELALVGDFQAENVATAAALALGTGLEARGVFDALPHLTGVRGRMQLAARRANGASVFVDYAHTPDALASALKALRPHCPGNLVVVFGAGGDRDRGKRPLMGQAAAQYADQVIVTDDNPRSEPPAAIRGAVLAGCPDATEIGERAAAILAGVDALRGPGDCLLVAGKGHEQGQEVAGRILPFDDVSQAAASVAALDGAEAALGSKP